MELMGQEDNIQFLAKIKMKKEFYQECSETSLRDQKVLGNPFVNKSFVPGARQRRIQRYSSQTTL